jgi:hypothetical protein
VVTVLFRAGVHVPVIPSIEVVGRGDNVAPKQTAATGANAGVKLVLTVIISVVGVAH